jgi:hypothetical protein
MLRQGRHLDRHTRPQGHVTGAIDGVAARLHDVADHGMVDPFWLDAGPLERGP